MCYWIEIRCALQTDKACYSARQVDTPMTMTRNATLSAVNNALFDLNKNARKLGWRQTINGWVCPKCQ